MSFVMPTQLPTPDRGRPHRAQCPGWVDIVI